MDNRGWGERWSGIGLKVHRLGGGGHPYQMVMVHKRDKLHATASATCPLPLQLLWRPCDQQQHTEVHVLTMLASVQNILYTHVMVSKCRLRNDEVQLALHVANAMGFEALLTSWEAIMIMNLCLRTYLFLCLSPLRPLSAWPQAGSAPTFELPSVQGGVWLQGLLPPPHQTIRALRTVVSQRVFSHDLPIMSHHGCRRALGGEHWARAVTAWSMTDL